MHAQKTTNGFNLRRLILSIFVVLLLSVAVTGASLYWGDRIGKPAYAADASMPSWAFRGDGTYNNPYLIDTADRLAAFAAAVNGGDSMQNTYIKLAADIDLSGYGANFNGGRGWIPIGFEAAAPSARYFAGTFDGSGATVSNLYINESAHYHNVDTYAGLFGTIRMGTIKNLGVFGSIVVQSSSSAVRAGGLAGVYQGGAIINSYYAGSVEASSKEEAYAGGLIGETSGTNPLTITNAYIKGTVAAIGLRTGYNPSDALVYAGGYIGMNSGGGNVTISESYNAVVPTASGGSVNYAGGMFGFTGGSNVDVEGDCYYYVGETGLAAIGNNSWFESLRRGLPLSRMTNDNVLMAGGAMSGLSGAFSKQPNDTANGVLYYPELKSFKNSTKYPPTVAASRISVAIGATEPHDKPIYKVTYDYGGIIRDDLVDFDLVEEGHGYKLVALTETGYTFNGWVFDGQLCTGSDGVGVAAFTYGTDITVSMRWTENRYKVIYYDNADDKNFTGVKYDTTHTYLLNQLIDINRYSIVGYTFTGWNTLENGNGTSYSVGQSIQTLTAAGGGTLMLFAQWSENTVTVYYERNSENVIGDTMEPSYHTYALDRRLTQNRYSKIGYTFTGWSTKEDGKKEGIHYEDMASLRGLTADSGGYLRLFAQWEENKYTISYYGNGDDGTGSISPTTHTYALDQPVAKNKYIKIGYTFARWDAWEDGKIVGGCAEGVSLRDLTRAGSGTLTLYARWTENIYTVSYDGNGNTGGSTDSGVHTYDGNELIKVNGYLKTGYRFAAWNTLADGSGDAYAAGDSIRALTANSSGTLSLYARWELITYTITYNGLEGAANGNAADYTIESAAITLAALSREGYTFGGWYSDAGFGGEAVTSIAAGSTGDKIFWAKWTKLADGGGGGTDGGTDGGTGGDNGGGERKPVPLTIPIAAAVGGVTLFFVIRAIVKSKKKKRAAAAFAQAQSEMPISLAPGVSYYNVNANYRPNGLNGWQSNPYAQPPMQYNPNGQNNPYNPNPNGVNPYNPYNPYNPNGGQSL